MKETPAMETFLHNSYEIFIINNRGVKHYLLREVINAEAEEMRGSRP